MIRKFLPPDAGVLRIVASTANTFGTSELQSLIDDMFETMRAARGVGLAAPQIGMSRRVIVFEYPGGDRAPGEPPIPPTVLINPIVTHTEGTAEDWEGCFSVPGRCGRVSRPTLIRYEAQGPCGEKINGVAKDFRARIIQHEIDHLNGILYTDIAANTEPYERPTNTTAKAI
jgi:peptide deformylase